MLEWTDANFPCGTSLRIQRVQALPQGVGLGYSTRPVLALVFQVVTPEGEVWWEWAERVMPWRRPQAMSLAHLLAFKAADEYDSRLSATLAYGTQGPLPKPWPEKTGRR
jgi:hypothetical protein